MSLLTYLKRKLRPPYQPPRVLPLDPYELKILDQLREARERREVPVFPAILSPGERTLLLIVGAVRSYLEPGGISDGEFINRVIAATDNPYINPTIARLEKLK